jgi:hypothetical protein
MRSFARYSVYENEQIEKVERIGEQYGNSNELKLACHEAYELYRSGKISPRCYDKIYSDAFDKYLHLGDAK